MSEFHTAEEEALMNAFQEYCKANPEHAEQERIRSAWHEAGHALTRREFFKDVIFASIKPDLALNANGVLGIRGGVVTDESPSYSRETVFALAITKVAGHVAEQVANVSKQSLSPAVLPGWKEVCGYENDVCQFRQIASSLGLADEETEDYLARGRKEADDFLRKNFKGLKAVADNLLARDFLMGSDLDDILRDEQ